MATQPASAEEVFSTEPDAEGPLAALAGGATFARTPDAAIERWVAAARRQTHAACAVLHLDNDGCQVTRVAGESATAGAPPVSESFIDGLLSQPWAEPTINARGAFARIPVAVTGQVIGQLAIADPRRPAWSTEDLTTLADAAAGIATELERRLAMADADRFRRLWSAQRHIHDMIGAGAPLGSVLAEICTAIERYDASLMPSVLLRDPQSNTLHSGVGPSFPRAYLDSVDGAPIGPSVGTCGPAAWFGEITISVDLAKDPKWDPIRPMADLAGVAHCWSMPMKDAVGEVLGTLALYGRHPRRPQSQHLALLRDWALVAGIAVERARSMDRLQHDARHDSLTGLPNRAAIFERLDAAIQRVRRDAGVAVLFVDLDGLKAMNDTLGHDVADEMIREIGLRLASNLRLGDFVGRFGGDEFIVISAGIGDPLEASNLGTRLLEAVAQPLPGLGSRVVTASIGVAIVRGNDIDAREAIRRADAAMYEAKRSGRDRCVFADADEGVRTGRRLELARALRGAEARGELHVVYQPVIELPSRRTVGVEALVRWNSPALGPVTPGEFIPIAEDTGSILQIGAWVLRDSCETLAQLLAAGHRLELSVNISARQLSQPDFPLWVRQTLAHAQVPAAMLSLELTETAFMRPDTITANNVRELTALGVRVVLDDFGTGYSSLTWLREHPSGAIKIDRSFVADIQQRSSDRAIVAGIIRLAGDLGTMVTAEGVETAGQLQILEACGCHRAQGFLISRPVGVGDLRDWLAQAGPAA